jgi:hypothetical protein
MEDDGRRVKAQVVDWVAGVTAKRSPQPAGGSLSVDPIHPTPLSKYFLSISYLVDQGRESLGHIHRFALQTQLQLSCEATTVDSLGRKSEVTGPHITASRNATAGTPTSNCFKCQFPRWSSHLPSLRDSLI